MVYDLTTSFSRKYEYAVGSVGQQTHATHRAGMYCVVYNFYRGNSAINSLEQGAEAMSEGVLLDV